jgi:hypothetical protein
MRHMVTVWAVAFGWLVCTTYSEGAGSEWVYAGPSGKLVYKTTPAGDRIMDFSHAGYMGGAWSCRRSQSESPCSPRTGTALP